MPLSVLDIQLYRLLGSLLWNGGGGTEMGGLHWNGGVAKAVYPPEADPLFQLLWNGGGCTEMGVVI